MKTILMSLVLVLSSASAFASEIEYGPIKDPMTIVLTEKAPSSPSASAYLDAKKVLRLSFQVYWDKNERPARTYMLFNKFEEDISYVQISAETYNRLNYYLSFTHETCPTTLTIRNLRIVKIENLCAQNR